MMVRKGLGKFLRRGLNYRLVLYNNSKWFFVFVIENRLVFRLFKDVIESCLG